LINFRPETDRLIDFTLFFSSHKSYFRAMKRKFIFWILLVGFSAMTARVSAQESPTAAAEREAAEERYKRMSADIENLKETLESYKKTVQEQRDEIRRLNEEVARLGSHKDLVTREDFKVLADKIKEVDERRVAGDKDLLEKVTAEFARLGKSLAVPPRSSTPGPPPVKPGPEPKPPKLNSERGYEYTIRAGDNPKVIAQALTKQGVKITSVQITEANPAIADWTKLRVGQKIFIPAAPPM
jgi:archaellum component FlaC